MIAVEQEKNLEIGSGDFEAFVSLAVGTGGSGGLHGDRARCQFLRNDHGKRLHAALGPVVDARKDRVLMVEIVVQNDDERRIECEVLLERAGAPSPCRGSGLESLRAPPSGGLMSPVPLAGQPPPDGAISISSWPTVC